MKEVKKYDFCKLYDIHFIYFFRRLDTLDGLTSADESIRPSSTDLDLGGVTDASSWVGDCVTMRRGASSRASRPLTRYLPVTTQVNKLIKSLTPF